ncbi:MAG: RT0821/Lpp0805 family surface protein [Neomegalonema sp.]|nr:RT0821/Lpp0805 family surface protein [Neomegalonema sp.]
MRNKLMQSTILRPAASGLIALSLVGSMAACSQDGPSKATIGTGVGALVGAAVGSTIGKGSGKTVAIIVGAGLGALIGSEIGRRMDEEDRRLAAAATHDALENYPSGRASSWSNPDSGFAGEITPQPAYVADDGRTCRKYTTSIRIDGKEETAEGVACRTETGEWKEITS